MNKLYKSLLNDGELSLSVLDTTEMVNTAIEIHKLSPVCAAALGRTLTACTFMSSNLKNQGDKLFCTISGGGKGGKISVSGNGNLDMRGYIENPQIELPLKDNGKLDVGACVGNKGRLTVVRSMGLKEPYSGSCELISGEIAQDFTAYYAYSEQQPTAMALGVLIGTDGRCIGAGGVIIQAMPGASEKSLQYAEEKINSMTNISNLIKEMGAKKITEELFGQKTYQKYYPKYNCLCSREYISGILYSLGKKEMNDIIEKEGSVKVNCEYCGKQYVFTREDADKMFNKNSK